MRRKHMRALSFIASASIALMALPALAQQPTAGNLEKLSKFQSTGTPLEIPQVPQTGPKADQIRKNLQKIKLPPGIKIDLYALVPDACHMAVGRQGVVTSVGTRKNKDYAVTDRAKMGVDEEGEELVPSIQFKSPNGVCFSPDGFLFIVEQNRVLVFPAAEFFYGSPDVA